ncbi:hypothetical protein BRADI_1g55698v3 [Brachypodium distachyon]|uniref:Uncharacterized protein n=1 Tax=Brachypodium distachyon TaxID=15368 RepID=A0A2K2DRL9_BRADI|nr:hypothetical protein BRADI_1g55698v3 [Brachypodium distachyon]
MLSAVRQALNHDPGMKFTLCWNCRAPDFIMRSKGQNQVNSIKEDFRSFRPGHVDLPCMHTEGVVT